MASDSKENDALPGALYAYDFLTKEKCSPEWGQLENALKDPRITNIAITAPYDTGKTSFLKSFFTNKEVKVLNSEEDDFIGRNTLIKEARTQIKEDKTNFKFISLPNFFEEVKDKKESEIELEKDIIGQLLFNSDPWKYPDSKINRLKVYPRESIIKIYIVLILFIGLVILSNDSVAVGNYFSSNGVLNGVLKVITGLFGIVLGFFLFSFVIHSVSKVAWSISTKFAGTELGAKIEHADSKDNKDLFLLYGDELRYYIYKKKLKYIIFEDLDRYNNPLIFQRLRELNRNLNIGERKLVFIYTLKDSIFSKENESVNDSDKKSVNTNNKQKVDPDDKKIVNSPQLKTKFFDYIISLMPNSSIQNTRKDFEYEINQYNILTKDKSSKKEDTNEQFEYRGLISENRTWASA